MHSDHQNRSSQDSIMPATLRGLVGKISSLAESICCFLIGLFIAAIVLITLVSVWYRYVLDNVWITFLGSAVLYRRVLHIAIDMLLVLMPASARVFFYWINEGLIFLLAVLMIWFGGRHALFNMSQTFGALEITPSWFYVAVPISGLLMVVFGIEKILDPQKRMPQGELHL